MNASAKVAIGVLAAVGALAVIGMAAMSLMHLSMMGGWHC